MLNKKAVMIISAIDFRDEELFETKSVLEAAGVNVTVAAPVTTTCTGVLGGTIEPTMLTKDVKVVAFDAVVFVGGNGAMCYWDDPIAHKIINEANQLRKVIGAICIAPITLANTGILQGKRATVFKSEVAKLIAKGATYTGNNVEYDGNIVTANGPSSAQQFGRSLVKGLQTM